MFVSSRLRTKSNQREKCLFLRRDRSRAVDGARLTDEQLFEVFRQSDVIWPTIGGNGSRMAASVIRAIDQRAANAHFAQGDFLRRYCLPAVVISG